VYVAPLRRRRDHPYVRAGLGAILLVVLVGGCGGTAARAKAHADTAPTAGCRSFGRHGETTYELCWREVANNPSHGVFVTSTNSRRRVLKTETPTPPPKPTPLLGHWIDAYLSPDGETILATWSGECEVPNAFFISVDSGVARAVTGQRHWADEPESFGRGWTRGGLARVYFPHGACGTGARKPGLYLIDSRTSRFVRRLGGAP
jgi:hypothetical protein